MCDPCQVREEQQRRAEVTARNRERAREWLNSNCDAHGNVYAGDVDSLTALLDEVDADHDEAERRAGMLKAVHGALIDAGLTPGEIGHCELDLVRQLTREREEARAEVERLRAYVGSEMTRSDFRTAADMRAEVERLRNGWAEVESLIGSLRYIGGIVERGEGRTLAPDESVQGAILGYVKTLESEVERLRARLELYDDGLAPEAVRALIVRRGL
jgi:hypothetical protein